MTQKELANSVNLTQATISRYLSGVNRPRPRIALLLEAYTGVNRDLWLFGDPEDLRMKIKALPKAGMFITK